jgi:hypothetical protein
MLTYFGVSHEEYKSNPNGLYQKIIKKELWSLTGALLSLILILLATDFKFSYSHTSLLPTWYFAYFIFSATTYGISVFFGLYLAKKFERMIGVPHADFKKQIHALYAKNDTACWRLFYLTLNIGFVVTTSLIMMMGNSILLILASYNH